MIFPKESNLFYYGHGNIQENFAFPFVQDQPEKLDPDFMKSKGIDQKQLFQLLDGDLVHYVPSSEEIMKLEPLNRPGSTEASIPGGDTVNE
jgi:hypothetical protein